MKLNVLLDEHEITVILHMNCLVCKSGLFGLKIWSVWSVPSVNIRKKDLQKYCWFLSLKNVSKIVLVCDCIEIVIFKALPITNAFKCQFISIYSQIR